MNNPIEDRIRILEARNEKLEEALWNQLQRLEYVERTVSQIIKDVNVLKFNDRLQDGTQY